MELYIWILFGIVIVQQIQLIFLFKKVDTIEDAAVAATLIAVLPKSKFSQDKAKEIVENQTIQEFVNDETDDDE